MKHFSRPTLASQIVASLQGKTLFGDAPNGLFLAAPRRTGKSTFLRHDLASALRDAGVIDVYVDLWSDQKRDPGDLIADAVARAVSQHLGPVAKAAKASGLESAPRPTPASSTPRGGSNKVAEPHLFESVGLAGWLRVDTTRIGRPDGTTLTDALRMLTEMTRRPVALIVDEAQHALTSVAGENAMAALKAARDTLNSPGDVRLLLVMSGSDRDKLLRLVNNNGAPFYGSQVQGMPALGADFVGFVADLIEAERADLRPVDRQGLVRAFDAFGARPQFFAAALGTALNPLTSGAGRFEPQVLEAAHERQREDERQMEAEYLASRGIEQAVLWRLLEQGQRFRPYDAEALRFYRSKTGAAKVSAQQAQSALEAIRNRTPALAWKSARGEYAVDDAQMHAWYAARVAARTWPPTPVDPLKIGG